MKQPAPAEEDAVLERGDDLCEAVGIHFAALENQQRQMTDHQPRPLAGEHEVTFHPLQNFAGVIVKNQREQLGELVATGGMWAEERGCGLAPGASFRRLYSAKPVALVQ